MSSLLPILILLPLLGGLVLLLVRRQVTESVGEGLAMLIALGCLILSIVLAVSIARSPVPTPSAAASGAPATIVPKLEYAPKWFHVQMPATTPFAEGVCQLRLGVDGISCVMVLLTTLVTFCVLVFARTSIERNRAAFGAWLLIASGCMLLVFMAMDLLLFYIGFEAVLVPLFALIAGWGDRDANSAAKRFVLYTLAGSIPMVLALLGIAALYSDGNEFTNDWQIGLAELSQRAAVSATDPDQATAQTWIFWLLFLGLGIKTAILPLHTWLPTTYGASHPTVSAFLAAVVLKLGLFGFLRLALPLLPNATALMAIVLGTLGAIAIVYGALAALAQRDMRLLMAYSSLSHVGFITLGMFSLNTEGIAGATLQMFNHGLTTAAMFLIVGCLIARRGTARWDEGSHGLASQFPRLAFFMVFFVVAGAGMPGLNNFVGELLALTSMIEVHPVLTAIGALGIVFGAWYSFRLTQNVLFGKYDAGRSDVPKHGEVVQSHLTTRDLFPEQRATFAALAILSLAIGILPLGAMSLFRSDVERIAAVSVVADKALEKPVEVGAADLRAPATEQLTSAR
ncbi:MAG: complex I subunit 4 family protein [Aureliella sp.]